MRAPRNTGAFARVLAGGAVLAALVLGACGEDTAPPPPPEGDPTFAAIHGDTLERSCALGSCHGGAAPAARLDFHLVSADDVVKICYALVARRSCLFSDKQLVVPFKPEASFLIDKLRGTALAGDPDPACAGTNLRMPFGLPPLGENQIKQVEDWIAAGAGCMGPRPIDAAVDAPVDADRSIPGDVASITAAATTIAAGQRTQVTVALTQAAPRDGQTVWLTPGDDTVLGVPGAARIEHDLSAVTFDVIGKRPAPATAITAATGDNAKSVEIAVTEAATGGPDAAADGRGADPTSVTWGDQATPTPGSCTPALLQPGTDGNTSCDK